MLFHPTPSKVSPIYPVFAKRNYFHYAAYSPRSKGNRVKCWAGIKVKGEVWNMERELKNPFNWKRLAADGRCWLFKYKRNGWEEEVQADLLIDGETSKPFIALSQKPIIGSEMPLKKYDRVQVELTPDMLNQCKDYDDCGCVVGRVALASIEGEVLISVYNSCDAHRNVELAAILAIKTGGIYA